MALGTQQLPHQQNQKMLATQQRLFQQHRHIAPAPISGSGSANRLYMPYTKPSYATSSGSSLDDNNPSVVRRNARERNRVKQVNNGFVNLRQHIPQAIVADLSNGRRGGTGPGANKKLSKVDTLRMAVEYIRRLQRVIEEVDQSDTSSVSSYGSFGSAASASGSPPPGVVPSRPQHIETAFLIQQQQQQSHAMYALGFSNSFQHEQEQQQLISPAASSCSDASSTSSVPGAYYKQSSTQFTSTPLKYEPTSFEEYPTTPTEDEELLDYISLWQEEL